MKKLILLLVLFGSIAKADCKLTRELLETNLKLDYQSFDQDMKGGWRKFAEFGCDVEAAMLIDAYNHQHPNLNSTHVLYWHAGQLYASANIYYLAKNRFIQSLNPNEPIDDPFKWNAYVNASVAFLDNDMEKLKFYRGELARASASGAKVNLTVVDGLINCFGKPYQEAYGSACRPKAN